MSSSEPASAASVAVPLNAHSKRSLLAEDWNSYFCNVNGSLASIFLNLGLRQQAPMPDKRWLLWVWVYFKTPRPDGLSDRNEAPRLFEIENQLGEQLKLRCGAILAGRITTQGRREFYYYGERSDLFEAAVSAVLRGFKGYQFDCGSQEEPDWNQYFNVLFPCAEDLQKMKNRDVLDVLRREGDNPTLVREVTHWVYFENEADRGQFLNAATRLGYTKHRFITDVGPRSFGLVFSRNQAVTAESIDDAVIELFRLAREYRAEYDGWETSVERG